MSSFSLLRSSLENLFPWRWSSQLGFIVFIRIFSHGGGIQKVNPSHILYCLNARCPIRFSYGHFGNCLHFNTHVVISASRRSQCHMKIHRPILVWNEWTRRQQFPNVFCHCSMSMEQRVVIKSLREERHESTQIHSKFVEHYGDKALSYPILSDPIRSYPILMSAIECGSFAWGEKALRIQDAVEGRQI
jgi:hypothetical protein